LSFLGYVFIKCCSWGFLRDVVVLSVNLSAAMWYPFVRWFKPSLALPQLKVNSVSDLDFKRLYKLGFRGVCFDKDNTLALPYSDGICSSVENAFNCAVSVFGFDFVKVLSNTAGTFDDKNNHWARAIEEDWGVEVIRHWIKKPGCVRAVRDAFCSVGCDSVLCVGDRMFSDIVLGNRLSMGCVLVDPLSWGSEIGVAVRAQSHEHSLFKKYEAKGLCAKPHNLLSQY